MNHFILELDNGIALQFDKLQNGNSEITVRQRKTTIPGRGPNIWEDVQTFQIPSERNILLHDFFKP